MKWVAIVIVALAIVLRFTWHSSFALATALNDKVHRGYSISSIVFWSLLIIGLSLLLLALFKSIR